MKGTIFIVLTFVLNVKTAICLRIKRSENETEAKNLNPVDTFLLDSMLKIVDEKFDTLSERISVLERGISNLQYYNVRSFRVVNTHLHTIDTLLHGLRAEIIDGNSRHQDVERSVALVHKGVEDLQSLNTGMFEAMEKNLVHFQDNMNANFNEFGKYIESNTLAMGNLKNATIRLWSQVDNLRDESRVIKNKTEMLQDMVSELATNLSESVVSGSGDVEELGNYREMTVSETRMSFTCERVLEYLESKFEPCANTPRNHTLNASVSIDNLEEFLNESGTLLRALAQVNGNVLQSISYYRHTGDLVERMVGNTEAIHEEQVQIREDLEEIFINSTLYLLNQTKSPSEMDTGCISSRGILEDLRKMTKNGTHLVEILTDLATISSSSIQVSLKELNREITRLNEVQENRRTRNNYFNNNAESLRMEMDEIVDRNALNDIKNRTEWIYILSEAIASNTGWIPYMFHTMRFVESQVNKTLRTSTYNLQTTEKILEIILKQKDYGTSVPFTSPIPVTKAVVNKPARSFQNLVIKPTLQVPPKTNSADLPSNFTHGDSFNSTTSCNEMLEFVYETNVKIRRLLPALTLLLGEPEPYIALVDGNTDREGRVEIYYKGRWGTICDDLGHGEAAYICRSLGYVGGVAAGNGYFGAGKDLFWKINVTCLQTRWCDVVEPEIDQNKCDHKRDFAVICDHMVRLVPAESEETNRNSGMVEIYHHNQWLPVCAENFGTTEMEVVCRQLGFRNANSYRVETHDDFTGVLWLMNVACSENDSRLDTCKNDGWKYDGCPNHTVVFIECE
ncbi:hypothetical protein CHS0354_015682 [Potamilus streckersoni]|uniref:SRCR domain-containing protein n=1 Tax=Potamilus streckersoni TaxID=2493646 RepID=A0AAE0SRH2_9BIVA|nr:hypothetical protein CHS0354_015682 [Potamilus streckersoni]